MVQWPLTASRLPPPSPHIILSGKEDLYHTRSKVLHYLRSQEGKKGENNPYLDPVINRELSKPQWLPFAKLIILVERISLSYSQQTSFSDEERIGGFWLTTPRGAAKRSPKAVLRLFWKISKAWKSEKLKMKNNRNRLDAGLSEDGTSLKLFIQAEAAAMAVGEPARVRLSHLLRSFSCLGVLFVFNGQRSQIPPTHFLPFVLAHIRLNSGIQIPIPGGRNLVERSTSG